MPRRCYRPRSPLALESGAPAGHGSTSPQWTLWTPTWIQPSIHGLKELTLTQKIYSHNHTGSRQRQCFTSDTTRHLSASRLSFRGAVHVADLFDVPSSNRIEQVCFCDETVLSWSFSIIPMSSGDQYWWVLTGFNCVILSSCSKNGNFRKIERVPGLLYLNGSSRNCDLCHWIFYCPSGICQGTCQAPYFFALWCIVGNDILRRLTTLFRLLPVKSGPTAAYVCLTGFRWGESIGVHCGPPRSWTRALGRRRCPISRRRAWPGAPAGHESPGLGLAVDSYGPTPLTKSSQAHMGPNCVTDHRCRRTAKLLL